MSSKRILVVDDEEDILELVRYNLSQEGYDVVCVADGNAGIRSANEKIPDLILLDLMLPDMNGLDVCKEMKGNSQLKDIPIIMISARGEEVDIVSGLELGADDYITKPFSPRILLARVRAVLRRKSVKQRDDLDMLRIEDLTIDPARHRVNLGESELDLTSTEFKTLHYLARSRGRVYTRAQIVLGVHGDDYPVTDRSVDVQIVGLRKKMGEAGKMIETVRGVGYRFRE